MHICAPYYSLIIFIVAAKVIMWCCTHMQIHTSRMTLSDDVNLEEFVMTKDEFSGADIKAICTEAGLLALRERRMKVTQPDFKKAKEKVMYKKKEGVPEGLYM
jgi:26S proteasome regulatory subunit T2